MNFNRGSYYQNKFQNLSLSNQTITSQEFEDCTFCDVALINCRFEKCRFINCRYISSSLSAVLFTDTRLLEINFKDGKAIGIDWTLARDLQDIGFINSQISYSSFRLLKIPKIIIKDCQAHETDFTGANLTGADFSGSDLEKAIFSKTNLSKSNFSGAKNYFIDPRLNNVAKARFSLPEAISLLNGLDIILD